MIHLNPEHPENNNIKLVNKNLPFIDYFNGEYWKTADKSTVLGNLLKSKALNCFTISYLIKILFLS